MTVSTLESPPITVLLNHSSDGLGMLDKRCRLVFVNQTMADIFGYDAPMPMLGMEIVQLLAHDLVAKHNLQIYEELSRNGVYRREISTTGKDGRTLHLAVHLTRLDEQSTIVQVKDITRSKRAEKTLYYHAFYDSLTGLSNRAQLLDRMKLAIKRRKRTPDQRFALLLMDLDRFKVINESLGYEIGDKLLQQVSSRLQALARPQDTVARFGGDEFAVLIDEKLDELDINKLMNRINAEMSRPFLVEGHEIFTSASTGVVMSSDSEDIPEQLLRNADIAMARAKSEGKANFQLFDPLMGRQARELLQLETDLRKALRHDEFVPYYQPIISLDGGGVTGFEALVRWMHPKRGLIMPGEFISLAEENGLIMPIGISILNQACLQMKEWLDQYCGDRTLTMSVNISGVQLMQPGLSQQVAEVLHKSGLPPSFLKLEITESVIMENAETTANTLNELKSLGLELAIDDFGTGYSSLAYLHKLPVDILKIDRSFISDGAASENLDIPGTIITLAHHMGMRVVAEGIEKQEQADRLRSMQCEYGQGYFYSRPLPRSEAALLLADS